MDTILKFLKEEEGTSVLEYGLMAALFAAVIMGAAAVLGQTVGDAFNTVSNSINNAS